MTAHIRSSATTLTGSRARLSAMGVKRGDHVAIWATNVPQWYITFWATVKIGAVLVTVNTAYKIHEAEYLLRQSDTHTLVMIRGLQGHRRIQISSQELCPELATTRQGQASVFQTPALPAQRYNRRLRTAGLSTPGTKRLSLPKTLPYEEVYRRAAAVNKNDVCNMQYTSGTTGFPKGVMLTHYNVVNNGKDIGDCMDLSTADRHDDPGAHVPLLRNGACHDRLDHARHYACCPIPYFSPTRCA